jgi:hypothetical protein
MKLSLTDLNSKAAMALGKIKGFPLTCPVVVGLPAARFEQTYFGYER